MIRTAIISLLGCCLFLALPTRTTRAAASVEGVSGLPTDVTPLLSIAGVWQPVPDQYIGAPPNFNGSLAATVVGNIRLPNGREGLAISGWAWSPASATATSVIPVNVAILEQQADGTLSLATPEYISDPLTHGAQSVVVADFNNDGLDDIFFAPYNETPLLPSSSTAYLSDPGGTFSKVIVGDLVNAHDAELAYINGAPTVYTGSYYGVPQQHANTVVQYDGNGGFIVIPDTGDIGSSSVAVADFYGDGIYSAIYGDFIWGLNYPYTTDYVLGIELYHLANLIPLGDPITLGNPYFNTAQYGPYQSQWDPHGKQHSYRIWTDDFNHDGMKDLVVQA